MDPSHPKTPEYLEIAELVRKHALRYPIQSKEEFVSQMVAKGQPVVFRGTAYDPAFAANLMPAFFFPVISPSDMVGKAMELIISRGLLPFPTAQRASDPNEG